MPKTVVFVLNSLILVLCMLSFLPPASGQESARGSEVPALGNPDYTKITRSLPKSNLPTVQPAVLWKFSSEVEIQKDGTSKAVSLACPEVADGVVYFGDDKGRLLALKAKDGAVLWQHEHGARIAEAPAVDTERVYFGSDSGFTAIRRDNGQLVWRHSVKPGAAGITPLPVGERVYASGYDGMAYALKCITGEVLWSHDFATDAPPDQPGFDGKRARFQEIVARPGGAACDGNTFVQCVFDQSRIVALDCETGKRRWTFQAAGWLSCDPTIVNGRVYVSCQDAYVYCLNGETGAIVWKYKTTGWLSTSPAVHERKVFVTHHRGRLIQIDAESGQLLKITQPMDEIEGKSLHGGPPLIANGTAFFATSKGQVYAFDIEGNFMRWQLRPSPESGLFGGVASDGRRIFVCTNQNDGGECAIIALGIKDR